MLAVASRVMFPPPPMSRPRAQVHARSRGEASPHALHRALVDHTQWLVPLQFFQSLHGDAMASARKMSFSPRSNVPPEQLWLFTEQGTAQQAATQGALLGTYVIGVDGVSLFGSLPSDVKSVHVNAGGFDGDLLTLDGDALHALRAWARLVHLERGLAAHGDPRQVPELAGALQAYRTYHVPFFPDGRLIAKAGYEGYRQPVVVCTGPDSYETFVGALELALQGQVQLRRLDLASLHGEVARQDVDALYLNPLGPGPTGLWPRALCDALVAPR